MNTAVTYSSADVGINAPLIPVKVDNSPGLPKIQIRGTAVWKSKDRVRAAIASSRLLFLNRRIAVCLVPANLPKTSGRYGLAISLTILAANRYSPAGLHEHYPSPQILRSFKTDNKAEALKWSAALNKAIETVFVKLRIGLPTGPEASNIVQAERLLQKFNLNPGANLSV